MSHQAPMSTPVVHRSQCKNCGNPIHRRTWGDWSHDEMQTDTGPRPGGFYCPTATGAAPPDGYDYSQHALSDGA